MTMCIFLGAVGANSESGFWLVHSVPRFAQYYNQGYEYPETGRRYGQAMLCLSLSLKSINTVGEFDSVDSVSKCLLCFYVALTTLKIKQLFYMKYFSILAPFSVFQSFYSIQV